MNRRSSGAQADDFERIENFLDLQTLNFSYFCNRLGNVNYLCFDFVELGDINRDEITPSTFRPNFIQYTRFYKLYLSDIC